MLDRAGAIDALTTHRHGEAREPCRYCESYYGDIVDKLIEFWTKGVNSA